MSTEPVCNCQGDWWGGEHVTGCPKGPARRAGDPKPIEVKLMTAWEPALPVELLDDYYTEAWERTYPGLRAALVEHEPHGLSATAVKNSAFGYRSAWCTVCDREIWIPEDRSWARLS